ncbi:DNA-binding MarR family transcriptional regulator [Mycolicibacterium sp. BK556]|uniref:MarR family winged helix-turn-helix transcriptional regulator n=1 Tax=unclassified Mycolicibacterium TaxID=2636767 RepID=UPI001618E10E|nr:MULTISPECIES: MarR family winged helix-turn-helix transcriptional regulator [unclassified Mycolicibacterium]MBB3600797.1 DNA-binding MarR family transcriptional regulator [Mycolicibacterium sp. BK556]MBB3630551.1 DNA-binding MarR family transcriptional regulator [Mycolicibacterium sp. BK607]
MAQRWLTDDQQRIWRNYLTLGNRLQAAMNRQLQARCGLSLADYEVLVALSERGPIRVLGLVDALGWEQSRVSHQVRRMRDRELLERHDSQDDRRGATLEITDAGRDALATAAPDHVAFVRSVLFDGTTPAQLHAFDQVMTTALDRLGE